MGLKTKQNYSGVAQNGEHKFCRKKRVRTGGKVKLLVEIFLSCEKFEKFDYQTFWSRFALGQPEKFDFQTFRRKSQKFAQKVKSLKIKLFCQKSLKIKLFGEKV